jgi:3-vinyl bacteriochlorophyllide hydratase
MYATARCPRETPANAEQAAHEPRRSAASEASGYWFEAVAACPWPAHAGSHVTAKRDRQPLYTPEERARRDSSPWTMVQAILAPIQFLVFLVSLGLVLRYLATGEGFVIATASVLLKTALLYTIMITGSIWEKVVFGKWLFARAFFWEDVFSMLVLALQTAYLVALLTGQGTPQQQMQIAIAAYAAYAINAAQFVWKLRMARLDAARSRDGASGTPALIGGGA